MDYTIFIRLFLKLLFDLVFDATILEYVACVEDAPLKYNKYFLRKNGGSTVGFQCGFKSGSSNTLTIANTSTGSNTDIAPDGDGVLAVLMFNVLQDFESNITLLNVLFGDYSRVFDNVTIIHNGSFNLGTQVKKAFAKDIGFVISVSPNPFYSTTNISWSL